MSSKRNNSTGCNSATKRRCSRGSTTDGENAVPKACKNEKVNIRDILNDAKMPTIPTSVLQEVLNDFTTQYLAEAKRTGRHSYTELTLLAILSSQNKCPTVPEIYKFVEDHFPAYWRKEKDPRKRIRHVLAATTCFTSYKLPVAHADAQPSSSTYTPMLFKTRTLYTIVPKLFLEKIVTGKYRTVKTDREIIEHALNDKWGSYGMTDLWDNVSRCVILDVYNRIQAIEKSRYPLSALNTSNRKTSAPSATSSESDESRTPLEYLNRPIPNRKTSAPRATPSESDESRTPLEYLPIQNRKTSAPRAPPSESDESRTPLEYLHIRNRTTSAPRAQPSESDESRTPLEYLHIQNRKTSAPRAPPSESDESRTPLEYLHIQNRKTSAPRAPPSESDESRTPLEYLHIRNRKTSAPRAQPSESDESRTPLEYLHIQNRKTSAPNRTSHKSYESRTPLEYLNIPNRKTSAPSATPSESDQSRTPLEYLHTPYMKTSPNPTPHKSYELSTPLESFNIPYYRNTSAPNPTSHKSYELSNPLESFNIRNRKTSAPNPTSSESYGWIEWEEENEVHIYTFDEIDATEEADNEVEIVEIDLPSEPEDEVLNEQPNPGSEQLVDLDTWLPYGSYGPYCAGPPRESPHPLHFSLFPGLMHRPLPY